MDEFWILYHYANILLLLAYTYIFFFIKIEKVYFCFDCILHKTYRSDSFYLSQF